MSGSLANMTDSPAAANYVSALRFGWLTPFYDIVVGATTRERAFKTALIAQARIDAGHAILDLACGTGTLAIWVKQAHPLSEVTGVDGDPAILAIAAEKARSCDTAVQFDHGMSVKLPYLSDSFDRALSSLFFHHLDWADKVRSAQELLRVLKPGAEVHIADWGRPSSAFMRALFLPIQLLDGFRNTQDNVLGRLVEMLQHTGFQQVAQQRTFSTVFGTLALYRAVKPVAADRGPH